MLERRIGEEGCFKRGTQKEMLLKRVSKRGASLKGVPVPASECKTSALLGWVA